MWFHIKARDMDIDKPNGMVITFWLWDESRKRLNTVLKNKNITDIKWIKQEKPPFEQE